MTANIIPNGSLSESEVSSFEREIGHSLPLDYRELMIKTNGGRIENGYFQIEGCVYFHGISELFGLNVDRSFELRFWRHEMRYNVPKSFILIGSDAGPFIALKLRSPKKGVYYFDYLRELPETMEAGKVGKWYFLSKTVTELLARTKSYRDAMRAWGDPADWRDDD